MLISGTLFLSACSENTSDLFFSGKQVFPEEYQVKNHTDGEISAFGLNIAPADEMGDQVTDWVSDAADGEGFQYFIYSDPDSWDVYLYYPKGQAETKMLTNDDVAVEYSDSTLSVYVTPCRQENISAEGNEKWILHLIAPTFGTWPSAIKLYWDGDELLCDSAKLK